MAQNLILLGHSSNTQRLIDIASMNNFQLLGIVDDNYFGNTVALDGLPIVGTEKNMSMVLSQYPDAYFFVNSPLRTLKDWSRSNPRRVTFIQTVAEYNLKLVNLIHSSAIIPSTTKLGNGIYVGPYTVLQNYVTIEDHAFIKEQVCIAHHSVIKQNVTLGTQTYVGAGVCINKDSYIGIKCCLVAAHDTLTIGENCIIHPGVTVMKDLPDSSNLTVGGKVRGSFPPATFV